LYTNAFLGFGPEDSNYALELTYSMFTDLPIFCFWHSTSYSHNVCVHLIRKLSNGYASLFIWTDRLLVQQTMVSTSTTSDRALGISVTPMRM
jgi:hypothetical protein